MYINIGKRKFACSILAIAISGGALGQSAQESINSAENEKNNDAQVERVTVTSQRRVQSELDVPISVSVFTAADLEKGNITEASEYLSLTPNVGFSEDGEGGSRSINIAIRGVSNIVLDGIASANSIGYYIDELSVGSVAQGTINPQMLDMSQVEVLRGPQGTYFGRNAVGGALNLTTNKPNDELYFQGGLGIASFGTKKADAIFNLPISEKFMVRGVFSHEESDTPITNIDERGNDPFYKYNSGRLAFRYIPTDDLLIDLSVTKTKEDEGGDISIPSGVLDLDSLSIAGEGGFDGEGGGFDEGPGFYPNNEDTISRDTEEFNNKDFTIVNARVEWDINDFTVFKSVTGWLDSSFDRVSDLDGVGQSFGPLPLRRVNDYTGESFSQEFRLQSIDNGDIDWTVGVFYADDDLDQTNQIQMLPDDEPNGIEVGFINNNVRTFELESMAAFAEVNWSLNSLWDLTLGGRYTKDKVTASEIDLNRGPDALIGNEKFNDFSPRIVVNFRPDDDSSIFASISEGYKSGGVDVTGGSRVMPEPFDSEKLTSYEIGYKGYLLDGMVRLSSSLFYLDWQDFQVQTNRLADPSDISSAIETTQNAGKASSRGFEIESFFVINKQLNFSFNVGYADATFDDYKDAVLKGEQNGLPNIVDVSGQNLPRTADWNLSSSLNYTYDINSDWDGYVRIDWSYTGETTSDIEGVASLVGETIYGESFDLPEFPYQIPSYQVVNLTTGFNYKSLAINAYVHNLFDEQYYTGTADNFGFAGIRLKPHQREVGIKFTYSFSD
ncbi:TonB-dependent receptor [Aliiglaciecola sp. 2_MG-2023]|uniref:TonB-dependent receptor n=1 Tax=unclassified Aliiglaciecola TaxID=2593648 RepID=UPI0026E34C5B|nr:MULTISPECIES: TonB-dependent receptor [unclassified Aliiglaciecola]MDO6710641.1 TonB-dependent receptor [Aliiglaciecola sp. 2_MG-2023]MDO6754272.1 TonB-dependent receptor [Aliiglaciecola sp. 1_MG-2023]